MKKLKFLFSAILCVIAILCSNAIYGQTVVVYENGCIADLESETNTVDCFNCVTFPNSSELLCPDGTECPQCFIIRTRDEGGYDLTINGPGGPVTIYISGYTINNYTDGNGLAHTELVYTL